MSHQPPIWALGTMSGTSLDGVDAAMLLTDGDRILEFGDSAYRPYSRAEQDVIRAALGHWPGSDAVARAADIIESVHIELLSRFRGAELIGFHGQTLAHDPQGRGTHQAGSGSALARALGLPVIWDFRSADVAAGGQGAPLAPFYHHACARYMKADAPVAFLNLGGVGNLTWVDPRSAKPETACLAFDTGPANAPVNDLMQQRRGESHDAGGALAAQGHADGGVIARFLDHPYFFRSPPKSLDRDAFRQLLAAVAHLSDADAAATLTMAAAAAVARGADFFPAPVTRILACGGGRLNVTLMQNLNDALDCPVIPVEHVGLNGDMLEAQAFAYLATRVLYRLPTSGPQTTGTAHPVSGGNISRP